jgi:hypothetical protein
MIENRFSEGDEPLSSEFDYEGAFAAEEEMIRYAEEWPQLSPDLRSRVLHTAFQAQRRTGWRQHRPVALAATACFAATVFVATLCASLWQHRSGSPSLAANGNQAAHSPPASTRSLYALPEIQGSGTRGYSDDWTLVEIWFAARSENLETLRSAFWQ